MGKKILLADDSITIQKVIELTFSDEDFEVVTVGNGRLAIERVQDVRPDIVLCDIIMPEKDGYEVCDYIKKNPNLTNVPVLLLTGAFEPFDQERAARVGSDGFLAKPFEPQTLIAKVKDLLSQAASRRAAAAPVAAPPVARPASTPPMPSPFTVPAPPPVPAPAFQAPAPPAYTPPPAPPAPPVYTPPPSPPPPAPPAAPAWSAPPPPPAPAPAPEPPSWAPQPAPAWTVSGRAPVPVPTPASAPPAPPAWGQAGTAEVNFISDEPYTEASPAATMEADLPSATLDDDLYVPEGSAPVMEDLMEVAPEEAASLQAPPLADEPALEPEVPWAQPTMEVSLEERAHAGVATHTHGHQAERAFEEVFEEEEPRPAAAPPPPPQPAPVYSPPPSATTREFEPEFSADDFASAPPPAAPAFEPEFEDSTSTVMFNVGDIPQAAPPPPPPPAPPVQAYAPPPPREEPPAPPPPPRYEAPVPVAAPPPPPPMPEPELEPEPEPAMLAEADLEPAAEEVSFSEVAAPAYGSAPATPAAAPSIAAEVPVPVDMVSQIAQRVIAQISDKVVREIAWEVIPELAEALIRKEIERLKAELQKI